MPDYVAMARDAARRAGFDPDVFVRQIRQESGFNPNARSPVGAQGIAQFMPETARGFGIDPLDPQQALNAAASWMADLKRQFGSTALALAAYNAGPGAVQKYGGIPPFEETKRYVASILGPSTAEAAELDQTSSTGGDGVDTSGDRPPSEFEPPSRFPPTAPAPTRASRMQARIADLKQQRAVKAAQVEALLKPGPDEIPSDPGERVSPVFEAQATQARRNRELELGQRRAELNDVDKAISSLETDLANDADPKDTAAKDPMQAERDRLAVETAAFNLSEAKRKATAAASPEEKRLAELEVRKAELGVQQAELALERTRNPLPPQRAPRYPDEIAQSEASAAASRASAARTAALTPLEVARSEQEIAKGRQDLLPKQQQILQSHIDTVKYLQGMVERGEMDPGQADAYVQLSKQATESALKGYTPFQEMTERRQAEQARQKMGIDLLNQRIASGTSLANSLMSAATNDRIMLRPGQTSLGIDPLAGLGALLGDLQGGQDVPALARGMLAGGLAPPAPAGPVPAGL